MPAACQGVHNVHAVQFIRTCFVFGDCAIFVYAVTDKARTDKACCALMQTLMYACQRMADDKSLRDYHVPPVRLLCAQTTHAAFPHKLTLICQCCILLDVYDLLASLHIMLAGMLSCMTGWCLCMLILQATGAILALQSACSTSGVNTFCAICLRLLWVSQSAVVMTRCAGCVVGPADAVKACCNIQLSVYAAGLSMHDCH